VLLLGQRVAMSQLMRGEQCIGKLADYTTQFIGDHIADFIVRNGGWVRVFNWILLNIIVFVLFQVNTIVIYTVFAA